MGLNGIGLTESREKSPDSIYHTKIIRDATTLRRAIYRQCCDDTNIRPDDTVGLSLLPASGQGRRKIQVSWVNATTAAQMSQIFTATVTP